MSQFAQGGVISYNGYTLAGPRNSVQLQVKPVQDSTGRYITHSVYTFVIEAWVTSNVTGLTGDGTDASAHLTTIRGALQKNGGALEISGFGFGDVVVNTTATNRDVAWGPKTLHLDMRATGNGCIFLQWVIEVAIKTCSGGSLSGVIGHLKEFVYNVRWSIKPNGCTIRTVEGHLETFLHTDTVGGSTIQETADNYRDLVTVPVPDGFLRNQPQEYRLSENKSRLYFTVTDEEQESDNAYPVGVARMECNHSIRSSMFASNGQCMPVATLSGFVEMAKPYPLSLGWEKAIRLMQERLVHATNTGGFPIIKGISISEAIFARRLTFEVQYLLTSCPINELVTKSGLFTKVASTSYRAYQQSMKLAQSNRGAARLQHDPETERLPDQCASNIKISIRDRIAPYFATGSSSRFLLQCPPADSSYLVYENLVEFASDSPSVNVTEMPTKPQTEAKAETEAVFGKQNGMKVQMGTGFQRKRTQNIQVLGDGKPRVVIVVRGRAYRVGHPVEAPELVEIMGKKPEFHGGKQRVEGTVVGTYGPCDVHAGTWLYEYYVEFSSMAELDAALSTKGLSSAVFGETPKKKNVPKL